MTMALRMVALMVALAAVIDPAIARNVSVTPSLDVLLPRASDPHYAEAERLREELLAALGDRVAVDGARPADAVVLIGRALLPAAPAVPVFALTTSTVPSVTIEALRAPGAVPGQMVSVAATLRGLGVAGQRSSVTLALGGTVVHTEEHQWTADDERRDVSLPFVPSAAGLQRVRVSVRTGSSDTAVAGDLGITVRDRRLRVLAYEARPSWPLAFVRRSLEADSALSVAATTGTAGRLATTSTGAPPSLASLAPDRYDVVLLGAPDAASQADLRALEGFVERRGGSLVLLPDSRVPPALIERFGLPALDEVVLQQPVTVDGNGAALRASELLLARGGAAPIETLGRVRHGKQDGVAVLSSIHGDGRVIISGALDAWRFRAGANATFDAYWRGLVADAAAAAPPPLALTVTPQLAQPGDEMTIGATIRRTEYPVEGGVAKIPAVSAQLVALDGRTDPVRLWPGVRPGSYVARIPAPSTGAYTLTVNAAGMSADAPLLVADDIVHAAAATSAPAVAAAASGGAVVGDVQDLATRLLAIDVARVEEKTHPMRSPWWILPFAGVLTAEWALRRRRARR